MRPGRRTHARRRPHREAQLTRRATSSSILLGVFSCAWSCAIDPPRDIRATGERAIIGGIETAGDPGVVVVRTPEGGLCTGTLLAPTVVLTAAHCLDDSIRNGLEGGDVGFGPDIDTLVATRAIRSMIIHRQFSGDIAGGFDIGLIRLQEPAPAEIEPVPWSAAKIDPSIVGFTVRAVGFGVLSAVTGSGGGVKRTVEMPITAVTDEYIQMGNPYKNTCQGDSGGPIFRLMGGIERVIAVGSFGELGCRGASTKTRLDLYGDFIAEILSAWHGPCAADGVCGAATCASFSDPDCDPCGLNGICAQGCARVDLDCPVGALVDEVCTSALECESRLCDPALGACARPCLVTRINDCGEGYECIPAPNGAAPSELVESEVAPALCRAVDGCTIASDRPGSVGATPLWVGWLLAGLLILHYRRRSTRPRRQ